MRIAILGCGFVADMYLATRAAHAELQFISAYDRSAERCQTFTNHHRLRAYSGFEELLADRDISLVLNLTNPRSHFETTKACLLAGKHVYSEKPFAMELAQAQELVQLAKEKNVSLAAAPCSLLSETAQTLWKGIREEVMGPVRLVYANFDDGMVHRLGPTEWKSASGAAWPARDEYEVGCAFEHAGYVLSWLAAFFGPARRMNAYATTCIPDKKLAVDSMAPDFTTACIEYDHNIVARVTCGIVAPVDKSISIIGEQGILYTKYVRNDASPVYFSKTPYHKLSHAISTRMSNWRVRLEHLLRLPFSLSGLTLESKYPYARKPSFRQSAGTKMADFLRGPSEQAEALTQGRPCRLSAELGAHIVELIETLQYPEHFSRPRTLTTTFPAIEPLPWQ